MKASEKDAADLVNSPSASSNRAVVWASSAIDKVARMRRWSLRPTSTALVSLSQSAAW